MCLVAPGIHIIYSSSYALYVESSVVGIAVVTTLPHCEKLKLYPPAIAFSVYIVHPRHVPMHVMFQCTLCFNASHVPMHVMVQYTQCSNARHVPIFLIWKNGENIFSMIILNITLSIWQNINSTTLPRPKRCRGHYSPLHRRLFVLYFKLINFYNKFVGV